MRKKFFFGPYHNNDGFIPSQVYTDGKNVIGEVIFSASRNCYAAHCYEMGYMSSRLEDYETLEEAVKRVKDALERLGFVWKEDHYRVLLS